MADEGSSEERKPSRLARKCAEIGRILVKEEIKARFKQVEKILKKDASDRTPEDLQLLEHSQDIVDEIEKRAKKRDVKKQRTLEIEDSPEELDKKCENLAKAIKQAENLIVYTGAGISTAASIPDYRGPNGVWTLLQQGKNIQPTDLSDAIPTVTHMSLTQLHNEGYVKYVVSQNCDGLHLRSGLPTYALSEVHGDMYIESCTKCKPVKQYYRIFDVTEKTALYRHKTERFCHKCGTELTDTIIHFGEKSRHDSIYQWPRAVDWVEKADMILCLGSSLKVLKKYGHLWSIDKPPAKRPKLYIVNLQWTSKDDGAVLKINGQCDVVLEKVMKILGLAVPPYEEQSDPIFYLQTPLKEDEEETTRKKILKVPENLTPPKWVYLRSRKGQKWKKGKVQRTSRKRKPDDNPPTKATKIKKEEPGGEEYIDDDLPSTGNTYAHSNSSRSSVCTSSSPRSSRVGSVSPLVVCASPQLVGEPPVLIPETVAGLSYLPDESSQSDTSATETASDIYPRQQSSVSSSFPNSPVSVGGSTPKRTMESLPDPQNSTRSDSDRSDLSLLIDEVVHKFADDKAAVNLDSYLNTPRDDIAKEPQVQASLKTQSDSFQTTRWLLAQPPLFNLYSQGLSASLGAFSGQYSNVMPPPGTAGAQFPYMMAAHQNPVRIVPPMSMPEQVMFQTPMPLASQTSCTDTKNQIPSEQKPETASETRVKVEIENTCTDASGNEESKMAAKYPILSGFIKIEDGENAAQSEDANSKQDTKDAITHYLPSLESPNVLLVDSQEPQVHASLPDGAVRQRLVNFIQNRSSQLSSGEGRPDGMPPVIPDPKVGTSHSSSVTAETLGTQSAKFLPHIGPQLSNVPSTESGNSELAKLSTAKLTNQMYMASYGFHLPGAKPTNPGPPRRSGGILTAERQGPDTSHHKIPYLYDLLKSPNVRLVNPDPGKATDVPAQHNMTSGGQLYQSTANSAVPGSNSVMLSSNSATAASNSVMAPLTIVTGSQTEPSGSPTKFANVGHMAQVPPQVVAPQQDASASKVLQIVPSNRLREVLTGHQTQPTGTWPSPFSFGCPASRTNEPKMTLLSLADHVITEQFQNDTDVKQENALEMSSSETKAEPVEQWEMERKTYSILPTVTETVKFGNKSEYVKSETHFETVKSEIEIKTEVEHSAVAASISHQSESPATSYIIQDSIVKPESPLQEFNVCLPKVVADIDESSKSSTGSDDTKSSKEKTTDASSASVPGWFGKGLKKYKKRR